MSETPKKSKAVWFAILSFVIFYAIYCVTALLSGILASFLVHLPLLGSLLASFLTSRGDTLSSFISTLCSVVSFFSTSAILEAMSKDPVLYRVSSRYLGISLIVVNVLFALSNLLANVSIWANFMIIAAGILFVYTAKNS